MIESVFGEEVRIQSLDFIDLLCADAYIEVNHVVR